MFMDMVKSSVKLSTAELEYRYLKRNAFFNIILGLLFLRVFFNAVCDYFGIENGNFLPTSITYLVVIALLFCFFSALKLWIDEVRLENSKDSSSVEDEFVRHALSRSREITLISIVVIAFVTLVVNTDFTAMMQEHFPRLVVALYFLMTGSF